jgi:hypothetical protein
MQYELTLHAKKRMRERSISESLIKEALDFPTKVSFNSQGVELFKKMYFVKGKQRLVILAGKFIGKKFKIFTVIETSKVSKYL